MLTKPQLMLPDLNLMFPYRVSTKRSGDLHKPDRSGDNCPDLGRSCECPPSPKSRSSARARVVEITWDKAQFCPTWE